MSADARAQHTTHELFKTRNSLKPHEGGGDDPTSSASGNDGAGVATMMSYGRPGSSWSARSGQNSIRSGALHPPCLQRATYAILMCSQKRP
jgi:hypothetical protein